MKLQHLLTVLGEVNAKYVIPKYLRPYVSESVFGKIIHWPSASNRRLSDSSSSSAAWSHPRADARGHKRVVPAGPFLRGGSGVDQGVGVPLVALHGDHRPRIQQPLQTETEEWVIVTYISLILPQVCMKDGDLRLYKRAITIPDTLCFLLPLFIHLFVLAANSKTGVLYHVQYFGDAPERGYIFEKNMVSFTGEDQYQELSQGNKQHASRVIHKKVEQLWDMWRVKTCVQFSLFCELGDLQSKRRVRTS